MRLPQIGKIWTRPLWQCDVCSKIYHKSYKNQDISSEQYCSLSCKSHKTRNNIKKVCEYCEKPFFSINKKQKCCSIKCSSKLRTKLTTCSHCSKVCIKRKTKKFNFCSNECRIKYYAADPNICFICIICNKRTIKNKHSIKDALKKRILTCSRTCYLQTKGWKKTKYYKKRGIFRILSKGVLKKCKYCQKEMFVKFYKKRIFCNNKCKQSYRLYVDSILICYACGRNDVRVDNRKGLKIWYFNFAKIKFYNVNLEEIQAVCADCNMQLLNRYYYKIIQKSNSIQRPGRVYIEGQIYINGNWNGVQLPNLHPKIGVCNICRAIVGIDIKRTEMHHEKYDSSNPTKHTIEVCKSCHPKVQKEFAPHLWLFC